MLTYAFPTHYQLVYINFDISSFSLISYTSLEYNPIVKIYYLLLY